MLSVVLGAAVIVAYLPALNAGFINWDDPVYVTSNPNIRLLNWGTMKWAFTTFDSGNWHPLTWLSLALDHQVYGLRPYGYHATNLALHLLNTVLVLFVFYRLTGALWCSAAVAALFGLHPLHVESVAWVAERKDVLSGFFWLLTMAAYVRYVGRPTRLWNYAIVAFAFALALLSKPMTVTLPCVLLLMDYWPLERLSWAAVREKIPLFILAIGLSASTLVAQAAGGALAIDPIPFGARFANAVTAYVKYVALTFWPFGLSPWYSHPALEGPPTSAVGLATATILLVGLTALTLATSRRRPWLIVGWLWFVGTLLPVIGLVQVGRQAMADRYTYLPHLGLFLAVVWLLSELPLWRQPRTRVGGGAVAVLALLGLGALTFQQTRIWQNTLDFWRYTAAMSPHSFVAHQALGGELLRQGQLDEALGEYRLAAQIRPDFPDVHARLGYILSRMGRLDDAVGEYRQAITLQPDSPEHHNDLADLLLRQGKPEQARLSAEQALALHPRFAEAHNNLGRALLAQGRVDEAVAEFETALKESPRFAAARRNLDAALARKQPDMTMVP